MIIQSESNFSATYGNTPVWGYIEYVSGEHHEISVLAEMRLSISPTLVIELWRSYVKKFHANIYFIQHHGESSPH
jgi:predicted phosphoadenosine phosphosulfate sulfurtransferase